MAATIIPGLLDLARTRRQQAEWNRAKAAATHTDPHIAHECQQAALRMDKEAESAEAHAKGNQDIILNIETLIHYLIHSPHNSAHRTLALRHLEDASMRLRREIGDPPSV